MNLIIYERSIYLRDGQPFYIGPWRETSPTAAKTLTDNAISLCRVDLLVQIAYVSSPTASSLFEGRYPARR
jgi:hypothetical protein